MPNSRRYLLPLSLLVAVACVMIAGDVFIAGYSLPQAIAGFILALPGIALLLVGLFVVIAWVARREGAKVKIAFDIVPHLCLNRDVRIPTAPAIG